MYEIKVLGSDEFDQMAKSDPRYEYVDDTNLGFADRAKGVAYVRGSHIHDLNKYLISHELEELEMDESTHEDPNGIRHKKGPKFFKQIFLPFIAPVLTALVPGVGPALAPLVATVGKAIGGPSQSEVRSQNVARDTGQAFTSQETSFPSFSQPEQPRITTPPITATERPTGALGAFSVAGPASPRVPSSVTGNVASILGGQGSQNPIQNVGSLINPDILERLKGAYSGRLTF